jgi:hypothetical protein
VLVATGICIGIQPQTIDTSNKPKFVLTDFDSQPEYCCRSFVILMIYGETSIKEKLETMSSSYPIRVAVWGLGTMGSTITQYLLKKPHTYTLAAVIDRNENRVGKELTSYLKQTWNDDSLSQYNTSITIVPPSQASIVLKDQGIQCCMIATKSTMVENYPVLETCALNGVNAITLGEECLYPCNEIQKEYVSKLDQLARENGVTLTASGYQDVHWVYLVANLAASMIFISNIEGTLQSNVEDMGVKGCEMFGVGFELLEFESKITNNNSTPCAIYNSNELLCSVMGWTVKCHTRVIEPVLNETDAPIYCKSLQRDLSEGSIIGMKDVVTTETTNGVKIQLSCLTKIYTPHETEFGEWILSGEPQTLQARIPYPPIVEITCATAVNRIHQVIHAQSGYLTVDKLGYPEYRN